MKITPISSIQNYKIKYENKFTNTKNDDTAGSVGYSSIPYYNTISFQARVDKGLKRFYEVNKDRMPKTLRTFVEKLPDKEMLTPLDANKLAFSALAGVTTVAGLKLAFPEEDLVQDVKDIDETKATRGILCTYRQCKDLFDKDSLVNNENFSVWLVKKILLESKTIDEINEDFINEANPDFINFFRESEPESQPIRHSTLSALGIKMPDKEYMTSLRYTREGYSDTMSDILSIAQQDAWAKLSEDEKLARATRFVLSVGKWWDSIPQDIKLDILASQDAELEFYQLYKKHKKEVAENREVKEKISQPKETKERLYKKEHVDTGIKRDDELFKTWLQKNLAIKREQLTEAEKREITIRQQRNRAENWDAMSVEEQIDYISRLKSGSEQLRFAMLNTWNNNPEILIKLSLYLRKQNVEKPVDILYGTSEFNKFQSQIMKDFWAKYPDFSTKLGASISEAHQKIKEAKKNDTFEELKADILFAKSERENYVKNYVLNYKEVLTEEEYNAYPEYMKEFIDIYNERSMEYNKHLPVQYIKDFFNTVNDSLSTDIVASWAKSLRGEILTKEDELNIEQIRQFEPMQAQIMNRAIEASVADILYECTGNPQVYMMSQTDCKIALSQIDKGYDEIILSSNKTGKDFITKIKNHKINDKKIEELYKYYKSPSSKIHNFYSYVISKKVKTTAEPFLNLNNYMKGYGKSLDKISMDSKMPTEAKYAFLQKFLFNMPSEVCEEYDFRLKTIDDIKKEEKINIIINKLIRKYNFVPQEMLNAFLHEIGNQLRFLDTTRLNDIEENYCKPRKSTSGVGSKLNLIRSNVRDTGNLFTFLCVEQVLADTLYKATNQPEVYALSLEELLDVMEIGNLEKKFPSNITHTRDTKNGEKFEFRMLRKLPLYKLNEKTADYVQEFQKYIEECVKENKPFEKEEIMYILNPLEGKEDIDKATMSRIEQVFDILQKTLDEQMLNLKMLDEANK